MEEIKDIGIKKRMENNDLKKILEKGARESEVKVKGKLATLKSPEQREVDEELDCWKKTKKDYTILDEFKIPHELLGCLLKTHQYAGLIFTGEGGIGKTIMTLSSIKKFVKTEDWEYSNGYTTPLSLYEFLYENRNKEVIVLDDIEGVFNNKLSLAILKGALWDTDGKRICQYSSKSDKATMPERFFMKAKIIILCNHIPHENDASTRAMISRTIFYKMGFSFEQKMKICKTFVADDEELIKKEKEMVLEILTEEVTEATRDFNFRTLRKLIAFVQYKKTKAKMLFKATTETDETKEVYLDVTSQTSIVKEQIFLFIERTGKSRRTFFRTKKEVGVIVSKKSDVGTDTEELNHTGGKNGKKQ